MRKLAARDFEDLLQVCAHDIKAAYYLNYCSQCALPVFEDLLPTNRENNLLGSLLFDLATWHAYAKLRLHTDTTVRSFRTVTSTLGRTVRLFIKEVCSQYDTTELPHEMAAHGRKEAKKQATLAVLPKISDAATPSKRKLTSTRKILNLSTYKYHTLGDYPDLITRSGTTDNASMQTVGIIPIKRSLLLISIQGELQHKMLKRRFARTNKRNYTRQLAAAEVRERFI